MSPGQVGVNLHVHQLNGELLVKQMVPLIRTIECFLHELDEIGLVPVPILEPIDPSEEIDDPVDDRLFVEWSGDTWAMPPDAYVDELVWNGTILDWNRTFGYYVEWYDFGWIPYGMSVSEPVDVILVRTSARTLYASSQERRKST